MDALHWDDAKSSCNSFSLPLPGHFPVSSLPLYYQYTLLSIRLSLSISIWLPIGYPLTLQKVRGDVRCHEAAWKALASYIQVYCTSTHSMLLFIISPYLSNAPFSSYPLAAVEQGEKRYQERYFGSFFGTVFGYASFYLSSLLFLLFSSSCANSFFSFRRE